MSISIQWSLQRFPPPVSLSFAQSFSRSIEFGPPERVFPSVVTRVQGISGTARPAVHLSRSLYSVERSRATPPQSARGTVNRKLPSRRAERRTAEVSGSRPAASDARIQGNRATSAGKPRVTLTLITAAFRFESDIHWTDVSSNH